MVVSAAAGATGSIAAQIAKMQGARVIGIAGSRREVRLAASTRPRPRRRHQPPHEDVAAELKELCPKRVDVFFDNVGGPVLDAVLARIANDARVVLCGAISSYNDDHRPPGPANYLNLIQRRASMRGFLSLDDWGRFDEIQPILQALVESGRAAGTAPRSSRASSPAVDALNAMFTGANTGKIVIRP